MADKENILERLKKLLALSKSDNPHEFAQALQRIQELMQIDHITCNDIGLNCIDSSYWVAGSVNQPSYISTLLGVIRAALGGGSIIQSGFKASVGFYGNKDHVELVSYTIDVLLARQLIATKKTISGSRIKESNKTKSRRGDKCSNGELAVFSEVHLFAMPREDCELTKCRLEQCKLGRDV